jgi:predicted secreted protein
MAGIAGKSFLLKHHTTTGGTATTIADLNQASFVINGEVLDITAFAATWEAKIQGLKSFSFSASGFWSSGDTNGQVALRTAMINNTESWLTFLPNGTTGFKGQIECSSFEIGAEVNGVVSVSISATGTGAVAAV